MEERSCSKCGGPSPFPNGRGRICKTCRTAYKAAWYQSRKMPKTPPTEEERRRLRNASKNRYARKRYPIDAAYREKQ